MGYIWHNGQRYTTNGSTVSKGGRVVKDLQERALVLRKARNGKEDRRVKR